MKSSFWQHTLATLALVVALPTAVFAQADPVVVNDNNVVVANGAAAADYLLTQFPSTEVGTASEADFSILNSGDADLEISYISVPAGFASTLAVPATVTPGSEVSFKVSFEPTSAASFSGDVEIGVNVPTTESVYTFGVSGEGVTEPITKNIGITWADKKGVIIPLKIKPNKKTGTNTVTGKAIVTNTAIGDPKLDMIAVANVEAFYSTDGFLDAGDMSLGPLKPVTKLKQAKPAKPGKPQKYKSKKVAVKKLDIGSNSTGTIFLKTTIVTPAGSEVTYLDNVTSLSF